MSKEAMKKSRISLFSALLAALFCILSTATLSLAQGGDTSVLRPPKGYKLAIVEFADLQCPDCSRAEPLLEEAAKTYKIPLVRYDFPLPKHDWSFDAHVNARWFDSKNHTHVALDDAIEQGLLFCNMLAENKLRKQR